MEQLLLSAWKSATSHQNELAEYARLEYSRSEASRIETGAFLKLKEMTDQGEESALRSPATTAEPTRRRAGAPPLENDGRPATGHPGSAAVLSYGTPVLARSPGEPRLH